MRLEPTEATSRVNYTGEELPIQKLTRSYRMIRALARFLLRIMVRIRVSGEQNLPSGGPFILVINHLHLLDPIVLMAILPFHVDVLVAEKYRKRFPIGQIVSSAGGIFVRRGEIDRKALRACLDSLRSGRVLGMSPEGTRSKTGVLQRAKPGVAYFVLKTGAPLLPIGLWGLSGMVSSWKRLRRAEVRVAIGEPFRLSVSDKKVRTEDLQAMADQIMMRVAELLPSKYRGAYADDISAGTDFSERPARADQPNNAPKIPDRNGNADG
jgi:1-acyl-sn-glycerol-3-phosphate acyltransferase